MDTLTYIILGTFAAFWGEEGVQMYRHGKTVSRLIGDWEGESAVRHVIVAIFPFLLMLHLAFFP